VLGGKIFSFNFISSIMFLASPIMTFGGTYPQCQRRQQEVLPDTTLQYSYWATSTSSPDHMISGIQFSNHQYLNVLIIF